MSSLTPLASPKKQLLMAAIMWSAVGIFLFGRGLWNILEINDPYKLLWMGMALIAGLAKAKMVFERTAAKVIKRIGSRQDPSCLFGFLPAKSWLLIVGMIGLGIALRHSNLNRSLVWSIYIAIGSSLFASSRIFWRAWLRK